MDVAVIRDWVIIIAGVGVFLTTALVAFLVVRIGFTLLGLVNRLNQQVTPILQTTSRAANTVAGTTDFVSRLIVIPTIRILTAAAAASRFLRVLFGGSRRRY